WLLGLPNCEVTVSLHPATLAADRAAIAETGVTLTDDYVIELIPQHDVYVSYFSSTIRWAIAAGKPVVNFDLYKLGLRVYDGAPGVATVDTFAGFKAAMSELIASEEGFTRIAARQAAVAQQWGVLDGQATARIAGVICQS